jgi:hypothetical protein
MLNLNPAVDRSFSVYTTIHKDLLRHLVFTFTWFRYGMDCAFFAAHGCVATPSNGAPERRPRDPAKQGSGSGGDARPRVWYVRRPHPATGSHLPAEGTAPPCAVAPQSVARGTLRSRDRAASGMPDCGVCDVRRPHPATGSHLPLEGTAPPCAVAPFGVVAPCPAPQKPHSTPSNRRI